MVFVLLPAMDVCDTRRASLSRSHSPVVSMQDVVSISINPNNNSTPLNATEYKKNDNVFSAYVADYSTTESDTNSDDNNNNVPIDNNSDSDSFYAIMNKHFKDIIPNKKVLYRIKHKYRCTNIHKYKL